MFSYKKPICVQLRMPRASCSFLATILIDLQCDGHASVETAVQIRKSTPVSEFDCELSQDERFVVFDCLIGDTFTPSVSLYEPNDPSC